MIAAACVCRDQPRSEVLHSSECKRSVGRREGGKKKCAYEGKKIRRQRGTNVPTDADGRLEMHKIQTMGKEEKPRPLARPLYE